MSDEEIIQMLMNRIQVLKEELTQSPQWAECIEEDIAAYQNFINMIADK